MAKRERECEEFEEVSAVVHTLYTSLLPQSVTLCLLFLRLLQGSVALFALSCSGRSTPALLLHWHWHGRHYAPDRVASSRTSPGLVPSLGTRSVTHTHNAPRDPKCDGYIYIYKRKLTRCTISCLALRRSAIISYTCILQPSWKAWV